MEKLLIHNHIINIKGVRKKIIYHFSDTHLSLYDEFSDSDDTDKAKELTSFWESHRITFAESHREPYGTLQKKSAKEHFENIIKTVQNADAVITAGDLMEYVNDANIRFIESQLKKLTSPFIAVCGNHEKLDDIPEGYIISTIKNSVQITDLGDMFVFAINNSQRTITCEQIEKFLSLLNKDKPILIVMHVPIMTNDNKELLTECGEYFQLNYDGADKNNFKFIEMIKNNAEKIIAVFAGHLHFKNTSQITSGVTQYVSSQGITGNLNRYEIGE